MLQHPQLRNGLHDSDDDVCFEVRHFESLQVRCDGGLLQHSSQVKSSDLYSGL